MGMSHSGTSSLRPIPAIPKGHAPAIGAARPRWAARCRCPSAVSWPAGPEEQHRAGPSAAALRAEGAHSSARQEQGPPGTHLRYPSLESLVAPWVDLLKWTPWKDTSWMDTTCMDPLDGPHDIHLLMCLP